MVILKSKPVQLITKHTIAEGAIERDSNFYCNPFPSNLLYLYVLFMGWVWLGQSNPIQI